MSSALANTFDFLENPDWRNQSGGLALVAGLHVAALGVALHFTSAQPLASSTASTIMVSMITSPSPEVTPEPPKPVIKKVEEPKKLVTAETPVPNPAFTAPPPDPPQPTPPAPTPPAPAADQTVVAPKFEANYASNPIVYPPQARRAGEQGRVLLHVLVGADGRAAQVEIKQSSGYARLDNAAVEAVKGWKFEPARQGALPVMAWATVPISFSLNQ